MENRLLYISNIAGKRMNSFFTGTAIAAAHDVGKEFLCAANRALSTEADRKLDEEKWGVQLLHVDLARSPFDFRKNYIAYKQLVKIIQENEIEYIHCNTPTGGILGRLAGKKCKVKKVIYQAHGFHFYKGAPKKNWLLYYTVEKLLARYTDALITINQEDYELAQNKLKLRNNGNVYFVHGVGIDTAQYNRDSVTRLIKRSELGLKDNDVAVISMGDLIDRKNYDVAIRAIAEANNPSLHYFICGKGPKADNLKALAEGLDVAEQVHFLGFRTDIKELLNAVDVFLFTTKQEGLPRSMMEAMAFGLPCIASRIRGNTDMLEGTEGGFLCETMNISAYAEKLNLLANDKTLRESMGESNLVTIQKFSTETVTDEIRKIYINELCR